MYAWGISQNAIYCYSGESILETESVAWGTKLIKVYFYSYKVETHQNWPHKPFWTLSHNLRNQVLGLNFSASLNRLFVTSQ